MPAISAIKYNKRNYINIFLNLHIPKPTEAHWCHFLKEEKLFYCVTYVTVQARIQGGGGQGSLAPPPIFWGKKQGGQKPHTQKKNDQNRTTAKQDTG